MTSPDPIFTIAHLRAALARPLPGLSAQLRMSPVPRPGGERVLDADLACREAAVLILLYPCEDRICLVLTRRTDSVANHQGQISLPGGSMDPGETPEIAALREAWEELAVDSGQVQVLGALSRLYIPPSNFCIRPVVGFAPGRPDFHPAPDEVAEIIEEPLAHLVDVNTCAWEMWQLRGQDVRVPFYRIGEHKVWGATAMVLCEFLALLDGALTEEP
jgi:8-oxo-dGTP pyrophosphatase MutT (NUDIX family)